MVFIDKGEKSCQILLNISDNWIYLIKQIFVKRFLKWNVIFTCSSFWLFPLLNFRRQNVLYLNARLVSRHVVSRIGLVTCTHLVLVWVKQGFIPHSTSKFGGRMKNVQSDFTKQKAVGIPCDNNCYAFCKLSHFLSKLCKDFGSFNCSSNFKFQDIHAFVLFVNLFCLSCLNQKVFI